MAQTVKLTWNNGKLNELQRKTNEGLLSMGFDIASRARFNAPVLTGALRNSIRTTVEGETVYVLAGGGRVPYARRREYENRLHPETRHYMERAFDSVLSSDWKTKYFGDLAK